MFFPQGSSFLHPSCIIGECNFFFYSPPFHLRPLLSPHPTVHRLLATATISSTEQTLQGLSCSELLQQVGEIGEMSLRIIMWKLNTTSELWRGDDNQCRWPLLWVYWQALNRYQGEQEWTEMFIPLLCMCTFSQKMAKSIPLSTESLLCQILHLCFKPYWL